MKFGKSSIVILTLGLLSGSVFSASTVTSAGIGISAYLPDNWIAVTEGDTAMTLSDTTYAYKSQITCRKHIINVADYPSAGSWTRSHFIAYLLVVQYSYDPFGAVLYFDSSAACRQDSLWAPEAFTEFYTLDTVLGAWNEYMQYTEAGSNGYEIYAIGDTADMKQNIGMYMAIISMMTIDGNTNKVAIANPARSAQRQVAFTVANGGVSPSVFDLLGKKRIVKNGLFNGVYCRPGIGKIGLEIK
jgi:hypothetical protein